jgi:hypothetical protein
MFLDVSVQQGLGDWLVKKDLEGLACVQGPLVHKEGNLAEGLPEQKIGVVLVYDLHAVGEILLAKGRYLKF